MLHWRRMSLVSRVIVTGAAGFVGSTLVDRLLALDHEVLAVDCFTDYYDRRQKERNLAHALTSKRFRLIDGVLFFLDLSPLLDGVY